METKPIKLLALLEATVVTSPARITLNFAAECREGLRTTLVTFARPQADRQGAIAQTPFLEATRQAGFPVEIIRESGRFDFAAFRELKRAIAKLQPDIVQTNSIKSHFLVSLIRNRRFRWIALHHGYTSEDLKMRLYNQLDRYSLRKSDEVVTVCKSFADDVARMGVPRKKIAIVPNSISANFVARNEETARECRKQWNIAPDEMVLVSIGRLSPEKGHMFLLEAISNLKQAGESSRLKVLIAGAGMLENRLAEQIRANGLQDKVKLLGHQGDIRPLFMIADLFVLPSLSEGSPMVLLESMAARVPIIATNVGGIPDTVKDGESALLIPPGDTKSLTDAIRELLVHPERARKIAEAAFDRVRECFSPDKYNHRMLHIFNEVMAGARS